MHGCHQHAWTKSTSCSGCYRHSIQVFTRNRYCNTALATKQGSTTLALASGHSCNRVPATDWRPDLHAHGNTGSTNHTTLADQSSHTRMLGSHYDPVPTAKACFTFPALATEGPSDPAIAYNKDSHASAHANSSSSSTVSSTIGNIHLHALAMEEHNSQVLTTARDLTTHIVTAGRLRNRAFTNSKLLIALIPLSSHQGSVVASMARTTEPRPVHEGAKSPTSGQIKHHAFTPSASRTASGPYPQSGNQGIMHTAAEGIILHVLPVTDFTCHDSACLI